MLAGDPSLCTQRMKLGRLGKHRHHPTNTILCGLRDRFTDIPAKVSFLVTNSTLPGKNSLT